MSCLVVISPNIRYLMMLLATIILYRNPKLSLMKASSSEGSLSSEASEVGSFGSLAIARFSAVGVLGSSPSSFTNIASIGTAKTTSTQTRKATLVLSRPDRCQCGVLKRAGARERLGSLPGLTSTCLDVFSDQRSGI